MLDIFKDDAFGVVSLTDAINELSFVPGRIGELGLFNGEGVSTTSVALEKKGDILVLVPPTPRGGPGTTVDKEKRDLRSFIIPHFEINDAIYADEVQNVRAWSTENQLETVMMKVAQRNATHSQSFAATEEYSRIGAVKGLITYADGSTLDLFTEFGVAQEAEVAFDLAAGAPANGILRKRCAAVVRKMADNLGGEPFQYVHAFCGDDFFDDLLAHKEVTESYKGTPMAEVLRQGYVAPGGKKIYGVFEFGGIVWENYRGKVGATSFVPADKCHMFPIGVPQLFRTYWAPADYIETVNTIGRRLYEKQYEMRNGKGIHLDVQMNELNICRRPKVLMKGKRQA